MKLTPIYTVLAAAIGAIAYESIQSRDADNLNRNLGNSFAMLKLHTRGDALLESRAIKDIVARHQPIGRLDSKNILSRYSAYQTNIGNLKEYPNSLFRRSGRDVGDTSRSKSKSPTRQPNYPTQDGVAATRGVSVADRVATINLKASEQFTNRPPAPRGRRLLFPNWTQEFVKPSAPETTAAQSSLGAKDRTRSAEVSKGLERSNSPVRQHVEDQPMPLGHGISVTKSRSDSPIRGLMQPQIPSGPADAKSQFVTPKKQSIIPAPSQQSIIPAPSQESKSIDALSGPPSSPDNVSLSPSNFQTPPKTNKGPVPGSDAADHPALSPITKQISP